MPPAASHYQQIRLTVTLERDGRASYRALVKPLRADWTEKHLFAHGHLPRVPMVRQPEEFWEIIERVCRAQWLDPHGEL